MASTPLSDDSVNINLPPTSNFQLSRPSNDGGNKSYDINRGKLCSSIIFPSPNLATLVVDTSSFAPSQTFDEATVEIDTWETTSCYWTESDEDEGKIRKSFVFLSLVSTQIRLPFQSAFLDGFPRSIRKTSSGVSSSLVNNLKFT